MSYLYGDVLVSKCSAQALRLMAQAYMTSGQPAPALQCVQNVRTLQDALGDSPALCLAAIKAHIQACLTQPHLSLHAPHPCQLPMRTALGAIVSPGLKPLTEI